MYALVVSLKVKPEHRDRFLATIEDDAICSERDEPGCLRFNVLQEEADQNSFCLYEIYRDKDAFAAHRETPHLKRFSAAVAEALDGPTQVTLTNTIFTR